MKHNETIEKFLKDIKIKVNFENNIDNMCYNKRDINSLISRYGMYKNKKLKKICVIDIIGKDRGKSQNILNELNDLFDENGNFYQKRSVSMLKYKSNEIIDKLYNSFKEEPIELKEIKRNKYIIANNGMHRVNLLKMHYYNELKKCRKEIDVENLNIKYTIKVIVESLDIIKTYSKYILSLVDNNIVIEDELDENYMKTENVIVYDENDKYKIFNNDELLMYVKEKTENMKKIKFDKELNQLYNSDEYFSKYMDLISNKK